MTVLETPVLTPESWGVIAGMALTVGAGVILGIRKGWTVIIPILKSTNKAAAEILHEQKPNSGGSLRDAINRIEARVNQNSTDLSALRDDISDVRQAVRRHDRELARSADAAEQIRDRMTREADREAAQLADHSQRIHQLEAEAHRRREETL